MSIAKSAFGLQGAPEDEVGVIFSYDEWWDPDCCDVLTCWSCRVPLDDYHPDSCKKGGPPSMPIPRCSAPMMCTCLYKCLYKLADMNVS